MQQGSSSRTPCRRLGLSRVSSASKFASSFTTPTSMSTPRSFPSSSDENQKPCQVTPLKFKSFHKDVLDRSGDDIERRPHSNRRGVPDEDVTPRKKRCEPIQEAGSQLSCSETKECDTRSGLTLGITTASTSSPTVTVTLEGSQDLNSLKRRVALKEKQVQQLCQTKIYHKKHDPDQLMQLVQHWMYGCQEALQELLSELKGHGTCISMSELLEQLAIPPSLVNFNVDTNEFMDVCVL